jgi:hypothetical protein
MSTPEAAPRSFASTMLAVAWSFIGLRRKRDFDRDVVALNPVYVIAAGLIGTAMLVAALLTVVHLVVK